MIKCEGDNKAAQQTIIHCHRQSNNETRQMRPPCRTAAHSDTYETWREGRSSLKPDRKTHSDPLPTLRNTITTTIPSPVAIPHQCCRATPTPTSAHQTTIGTKTISGLKPTLPHLSIESKETWLTRMPMATEQSQQQWQQPEQSLQQENCCKS